MTDQSKVYTYKDYLTYDEGERIEIIEGEIISMTPAPSRIHQKIILKMSTIIENYIQSNNGQCEVYSAPFDVILTNGDEAAEDSKNVVQPDISVICDKNKLTDKGCTGSPDMIVEVVSPYNPSNDYIRKLKLYQQFKVREYWIVNPMKESVFVYTIIGDEYDSPTSYTFNDSIKVNIYENLEIDFKSFNL